MTANNSFRPGKLWPDNTMASTSTPKAAACGFTMAFSYWFGEHKIEGQAGAAAHIGAVV
jgi:hypothetical protein